MLEETWNYDQCVHFNSSLIVHIPLLRHKISKTLKIKHSLRITAYTWMKCEIEN